jgi:lysophospholipase L1-like esterase
VPQQDSAPRFWTRYVALGDSLTEGMCDPAPRDTAHPWRGWADRTADALAVRAAEAGRTFEYANLAIRGRVLRQIVREQVPVALDMKPDLVSLIGGGNDVLRPGVDVDAVTDMLEESIVRFRSIGATVLMATSYDPRKAPLVRRTRGNAGIFAANVWSIARRHGCVVLDLWGMPALQDRRMWAPDRIHLVAEGHHRVAAQALDVLGVGGEEALAWATPLDPESPRGRQEALRDDALWVREHLLPWVGRRIRRQSSGDGLPPKRPQPTALGSSTTTLG